METRDLIVVGGGHNGLVAAAYCAAAGLKVTVLERRAVVGGAAATEEFHPGFRNSVAAYAVSLLNPVDDPRPRACRVTGCGSSSARCPISCPCPTAASSRSDPGGPSRKSRNSRGATPTRLDAYEARLERMADVLRAIALEAPPNVTSGRGVGASLGALLATARVANRLRPLRLEGQRDLLEIFTRSAGDVLDQAFESDPIKAILGFDGIVGTYASPYAAGTAYVLLHHGFGEANGRKGAWGHAIGGMGAITQAMARARPRSAESRSARRRASAEIVTRNGRAAGVVTESGERIEARAVVSGLHPKLTFEKLVDPAALPADFRARIASWRSASGVFRMNVALAELPSFACLPGRERAEHHGAGIVFAPSLAYMERAFFDARLHGWSAAPIIEMLIPSVLDEFAQSSGAPCRLAVLPTCRAAIAGRAVMGRGARNGRRPHDRHGRGLRAGLQGVGHRANNSVAARPRARLRHGRRRHFPRLSFARPALFRPARPRPRRLPLAGPRPLHVRFLDPSGRRGQRASGTQRRSRDRDRLSPPKASVLTPCH